MLSIKYGESEKQRGDSPQISFVLLGERYYRSPGAGQTGAAAGHGGCTPYL